MTNARKTLALAATFVFLGVGSGAANDCSLLTSWTPQCQQEKQQAAAQAAAERKIKIDHICTVMGFSPTHPRWQECIDYVNYHLQESPPEERR
jgi:hypothetical protein